MPDLDDAPDLPGLYIRDDGMIGIVLPDDAGVWALTPGKANELADTLHTAAKLAAEVMISKAHGRN